MEYDNSKFLGEDGLRHYWDVSGSAPACGTDPDGTENTSKKKKVTCLKCKAIIKKEGL